MKSGSKLSSLYKTMFHKRNIIIMSERSTSHMSMSGKLQFALLASVVGVIGAASFSTGQYMEAKNVISEQDKTIRSVANSRIQSNYGFAAVPSLSEQMPGAGAQDGAAPITDTSYSFSNMDESKLVARIAFLENRVGELQQTNEDIVKVVRKTADGQIKGLEEIIAQTGLSPDTLKRHAQQEKRIRRDSTASLNAQGGQGGPYIPAYWDPSMQKFAEDLGNSTDELYVLRKIIEIMPTDRPMTRAKNTSGFGHRRDPFTGRVAFHSGLDFASNSTPQIVATSDGVVSLAKRVGSYGNMVELKHGLGLTTRYAHLSRILVKPGQKVKKGQVVGIQGSTGRSTGAHLHYEVRFNNRPLNPKNFLKAGDAYVQKD